MATPITRNQFDALTNLELALRATFFDQIEFSDPLWGLVNVQDSSRAAERTLGTGGFGDVPEYTGTIEYDSFEELYTATFTHKQYALGMAVERQLIDDDEYGVMATRASRLGLSFDRSATKAMVNTLNNAFATVTGPDGVVLCSASHPYSPTNASVQSNAGSSALTHDAVVSTRIAMMNYEDSQGNPMNIMPDTLVVPINLMDTANVIVGSAQRSGSANNDVNTNAEFNVVTSHYLTDSNNWFMVDSRMARMHWQWYWRVRPEFKADPTSDYNLVMKYRGYMRYSYGWDHWAWVYGHNVS